MESKGVLVDVQVKQVVTAAWVGSQDLIDEDCDCQHKRKAPVKLRL
jgi:hypothetical protein